VKLHSTARGLLVSVGGLLILAGVALATGGARATAEGSSPSASASAAVEVFGATPTTAVLGEGDPVTAARAVAESLRAR